MFPRDRFEGQIFSRFSRDGFGLDKACTAGFESKYRIDTALVADA
jgi:hypothetical protein